METLVLGLFFKLGKNKSHFLLMENYVEHCVCALCR